MELLDLVRITQSGDRCLVGPFRGIPVSSLNRDAKMKTKDLKQSNASGSPARPDARVQHVGLQFGKGSGERLRFASAARECLVMKRTTLPAFFPSHSGSWSSLMAQSGQHERGFRTAPAMHWIFVRLAIRLRSIIWAIKKATTRQPKRHSLNLARGGSSGGGAQRAEIPLRTEQVASFADVCCAKRSNCGL